MIIVGFIIAGLVLFGGAYTWFFSTPVKDNKVSQWDIINYVDIHIPILEPGRWHIDTYTKDRSNWLTLNLRDEDGNVLDSRTVNTTYRDEDTMWSDLPKAEFYDMLYLEVIEWALGYMPVRNKVA